MDIDQYQTKLIELWGTPPDCDHLLFCAVGMAEEAGEALGKVKRLLRGDGFDREGYLIELGDVLAYLTMAAHEKGWKLNNLTNYHDFVFSIGRTQLDVSFELFKRVSDLIDCLQISSKYTDEGFTMVLYLIKISSERVGSSIEEIAQLNIDKLTDRKNRNVLRGSGDKR